VLVVDDEPLIRWAMGAALTSARYEVKHVHPNCRFILMTACRTPVVTVPDVPVIDKPFHIDEVIDRVNQSVSAAV
jgi:DNA-binding response OmpR family regulator